jgi:hypothetical protein
MWFSLRYFLLLTTIVPLCSGEDVNYSVVYSISGVDRIRKVEGHTRPYIKRISKGDTILAGDTLTTGDSAFCEIKSESNTIRLGSDTILRNLGPKHWQLIDGSILLCLMDDTTFQLDSKKGSSLLSGPSTIITENTTNGGYKIISLSGKTTINIEGEKTQIPSGRLALVLGEKKKLGDGYDIDLLLLLRSSLLINAFEEPPPTMGKIGLAVYAQQKKLKGKFDILIGDAPTDKNLQMWVMGKEADKK